MIGYKPHTIFLSLPVKDFLCIDIVENKFLSSLSQWKKTLFYTIYFPESASSIRRRQKCSKSAK